MPTPVEWGASMWQGVVAFAIGVLGLVVTFWPPDQQQRGRRATLFALFVALGAVSVFITRHVERVSAAEAAAQAVSRNEADAKAIGTMTGGGSFAYLWFTNFNHTDDTALVTVLHEGEFPLYDVRGRLVHLRSGDLFGGPLMIGNMAPGIGRFYRHRRVHLAPLDAHPFNVFFDARNGAWKQNLRLVKLAGKWHQATRVWRTPSNATQGLIMELVSPDFPRGPHGLVDWAWLESTAERGASPAPAASPAGG